MARDEADIIGRTVAHLVNQGARVIVADNLSADGTGEIAAEAGAEVVTDDELAYRQGEKMTRLAKLYARQGEWVIPFDADEEWDGIDQLDDAWDVAVANPVVQIPAENGWRASHVEPYPKVAFRWNPNISIHEGNHAVSGAGPRIVHSVLKVRHYQYRSLEQVARKVRQGTAGLQAAGHPESTGQHWRDLARLSDEELSTWWTDYCRR